MNLSIDAAFDGGNIAVVEIREDEVDLAIEPDRYAASYQWFFFRLAGAAGRTTRLRIVNAGGAAFPKGWHDFKVRASTDRQSWRLIPTDYADGTLSFTWPGDSELAWFAYFVPYTMERHHALVARIAARPAVAYRALGRSLDGQVIDLLQIGTGGKPIWLYARQHPGEPMSEWWVEGALEWLTSASPDPGRDALLAAATLYVVPNMNPDGTRRGHLRTNAAGVNLNREWHRPSRERSPEVLWVREAMDVTGVAFSIDAHGDEAIPATFIVGFEGVPSFTDQRGGLLTTFASRLAAQTPDFQTQRNYGKAAPGKANLSISTNQLAERFGAVSTTLEMPFKDHDPNPDPAEGWSPARSKALGAACLDVLAGMIDVI